MTDYRRDAKGWPIKEDGRPYKMGELSADEQRRQFRGAVRRLQTEFEHPAVKEKLGAILDGRAINN
jgi:hypothetical protein